LRRDKALTLLKKLKTTFESINYTNYVLLKNKEKVGYWQLCIQWTAKEDEKLKLQPLLAKYNLEVFLENGYATFSKTKLD